MKILALYDIHANIDALDAVLADPRAQRADVVVIGGDAVPGPFAQATLERLQALEVPVSWLRGNGEREVAEALDGTAGDADLAASTAQLTATEIGSRCARSLGDLPLTLELDSVLFCHASPRRDDEMLTRLSSSERWTEALVGVTASLLVAGHTHQQDDRMIGATRFVNAGSVGLPYEGDDGGARWLWIEDGVPELRKTAYGAAEAGARMLAAGWPDERSVEGALIEPVAASIVTRIFEDSVTA
ncbi:MAG TPA: metallophosphoesterase family protein [Solirubrobacteraceae bacterium]